MKKKILLTAVAAAAIAVSAQAQVARFLKSNQPYTFTGTAAGGTGNITYKWYRNGVAISGATSQSYTMPADMANGSNVEIKRGAVSSSCPNNIEYTNRFVITFVECMQIGTVGATNAACWAEANVDAYQVFASQPDMYTCFYQWNRDKMWSATCSVSGWNSTADNSTTWTVNPCPTGWRLPTQGELNALNNMGNTWVAANSARGNEVAGRFYGPNHATSANCTLPDNMTSCIFMPAGGYRSNTGVLSSQGAIGDYWSSTQVSNTNGYYMSIRNDLSDASGNISKAYGFTIRCVLQ